MKERFQHIIDYFHEKKSSIARELNVSEGTIRGILSGRIQSISGEMLISLQEKYNINPVWLIRGEGEMFFPSRMNVKDDKIIPGINDMRQISRTEWFVNLSKEQKEIITGLDVIRDRNILKKVSVIITSQVTKERAHEELNRGLEELGGSGVGRRKK